MARLVGGLIAGAATALVAMLLVQWTGHLAWPLPAELDLENPEAAARALSNIPLQAKAVLIFSWFAGGLVGALVAGLISRRYWSGWAVALMAAGLAILSVLMVPFPAWMQISAVAAPLLGGLAAHHLPAGARTRSRDAPLQQL